MSASIIELRDLEKELRAAASHSEDQAIAAPLEALEASASAFAKASSGSWLGYHANVYYEGFNPPPPGAHFSSEWGLAGMFQGSTGEWREYQREAVVKAIEVKAGSPNLRPAREVAAEQKEVLSRAKDQVISILEIEVAHRSDSYLSKLLEDAKQTKVVTVEEFVDYIRPKGQFISRDALAVSQGSWTPPHSIVIANVMEIRFPAHACTKLADIAQKAASHLERLAKSEVRAMRIGTNVFIGHGRSPQWRELKDFIRDRLALPADEFNRIPTAGITNIARLSEMLDAAAFAFVIMTAEDEQVDGSMHARMNVIHEVGLFQGRLGFTKAIVLLEEGCAEFSNIQGLGQIRYPKGNIRACFEEVRQVLEREGVLS